MMFQKGFKTCREIYLCLIGFKLIGYPESNFFIMATLAILFATIVGCRVNSSLNEIPTAIMPGYRHAGCTEKQYKDYQNMSEALYHYFKKDISGNNVV